MRREVAGAVAYDEIRVSGNNSCPNVRLITEPPRRRRGHSLLYGCFFLVGKMVAFHPPA